MARKNKVTGFVSSPIYQPNSPDYSGISLEREYESPAEDGEILPDPFAEFTDEDFDLVEQHMRSLRLQQAEKSKSRTKERAESQFDSSAKPISLQQCLDDIQDEPMVQPTDLITDDHPTVEPKYLNQTPADAEDLSMLAACYGQNNGDSKIHYPTTVKSTKFPESINKLYLEKLKLDVSKCEPNTTIYHDENLKYKNDLFFVRRMIQSLQFRYLSDKEFIEKHFPMDERVHQIDVKYMYDNSNLSKTIINRKIQDLVSQHSILQFVKGKDWKDRFRRILSYDCNDNMQCVLILSHFLFQTTCPFEKRDIKLIQLDESLYRKSKFKFMTIGEIFNYLRIFFIDDYCPFEHYRDKVTNLIGVSNKRVKKEAKIRTEKEKSKKQKIKLITVQNESMDISIDKFLASSISFK